MKKNEAILAGAIEVVALIVFNVLSFTIYPARLPHFWVAFSFVWISFILHLIVTFGFLTKSLKHQTVMGVPLLYISAGFLAVQIVFSLIAMGIMTIAVKWVVLVETILLALFIILMLLIFMNQNRKQAKMIEQQRSTLPPHQF